MNSNFFDSTGLVSNCYSTSSVTGEYYVGGLVGDNAGGTIINSYSAGPVFGGEYVGGLAGESYVGGQSSNCFWDVLTSNQPTSAEGEPKNTTEMQTMSTFTSAGWDFSTPIWTIDSNDYPRLAWENTAISMNLILDNLWMYQSLPGLSDSTISTEISDFNDPLANSSYSYYWSIELPNDVTIEPIAIAGGDVNDDYFNFAAPSCDDLAGLSDSGQTFKIILEVVGNDFGNSGIAEKEFAIALLGDVNNDGVVNVADRSITNVFWRTGSAGPYTLKDCDMNCDGVVNVADRSITNAIWRGLLGSTSVSQPCPLR